MITRRAAVLNFLTLGFFVVVLPASAAPRRSRAMQALDADNDGTVDLEEAKKAASTLFDKLDRDHDGTLDRRELRGRLRPGEFAAADPDKDRTVSKDEYLKVVADASRPPIATTTGPSTTTSCARAPARLCCGCCSRQARVALSNQGLGAVSRVCPRGWSRRSRRIGKIATDNETSLRRAVVPGAHLTARSRCTVTI